ncbi:type I-E CRISPR-associated endoribonuclease Cas2e [Dubosiella newyorkensis]|uniref:type I-E CRISPR-associated endoribonuclease Cas2e n=2 Tax=Dubosiella newyorkensis TaxID=1862672 RepID=UPI002353B1A7|nr:type I-E CRISPR-associated endoribonuclease Cas2e [Dubosiella newyorkensis]MCI9040992.1 type I-E CRISPR-associated endoribonuclease Cas2 [Dubosiella newyorkensis]
MVVITLTDCPPKVRGDLSQWLLEVSTGVFVGNLNKRVREKLWKRVCENLKTGRACLVYSANNEQRLEFETFGSTWSPLDFDGIKLIKRPLTANNSATHQSLEDGYSSAAKYRKAKNIQKAIAKKDSDLYVVLDLETTGLNVEKDEIIEVGALLIKNTEIDNSFTAMIDVGHIPKEISKITGITEEMLKNQGKTKQEVIEDFYEFIHNKTIVGYNIAFDLVFLKKAFKEYDLNFNPKVIDVMSLVKKQMIDVANYKLETVARYYSIDYEPHRAFNDCLATYRIYTKLNKNK